MTSEMAVNKALLYAKEMGLRQNRVVNAKLFTDSDLAHVPSRIREKLPCPPYWTVAVGMEEAPDCVESLPAFFIEISDETGEIFPTRP